ncbi:ABC transporter permease [Actinomadura mexicana]|uniref:Putative ABC transport system permease protein n=1 Tax=Actinomadura mexicana TaxID=134959 RepID=A0A238UYM9_9ACTN|nr:ABC transporter permease [Actinomadura mexicana]SNR27285.1 putative ABC transport system permease protein [Actinomadura mexicana]
MLVLMWLGGLLARRPARLAMTAAGIAVAVGLLASLGTFLASAKSTMTQRSAAGVAVDWQVEMQPGAAVPDLRSLVRGVKAQLPVGFAATTGLQSRSQGQVLDTGPGQVLGLPPGYAATFPGELRALAGRADGVLLAQQTAANLHAAPGSTVTIHRAGLPDTSVRVDGVVDLPAADSLFQKVGAPAGAQPQAPPDNIVLLPAATWHRLFDNAPRAAARTQVHVRLSRNLPADPSAAYIADTGAARNLEAGLAGTGLVGDNLGAALGAAREDAAYAQVLFLFLGVPGAALAALLTALVAASGAPRRRAEQALLRTRGASLRTLLGLAAAEAALTGIAGAAVGLGLAALTGRLVFGAVRFGTSTGSAVLWAVIAAAAGLLVAALTVLLPAARDAATVGVVAARRAIGPPRRDPAWMRYGVDLWLLAASALVFWITSRNGYTIVLVPEGLPTISVSYWAFAGPALLWTGGGLLAWRVVYMLLGPRRSAAPAVPAGPSSADAGTGAGVGATSARFRATTGAEPLRRRLLKRLLRPIAGPLAGTVTASLSGQRTLLARTVSLAALAVVFAASTAVFDATYRQQAVADAQLTNGADVTVTESPGAYAPPSLEKQIAATRGVGTVEPLQHRLAYVGADLQDIYGIRTSTIARTTHLQNAYFSGGTTHDVLSRLAHRPDGVLVSVETVKDFQLQPGDLLRLRLQDGRTKQYRTVPFHYTGVVKEFPTAPRDSFLVANADYIARQTGTDTIGSFLVNTRGGASPPTVAHALRNQLGPQPQITDIHTTRNVVGSSLTAVDLGGLTRIELGYAFVLVALATGLLLALGFTEHRRNFALVRAMGARPRQVGAFIWAEVAVVLIGAAALGSLGGWILSRMLVKVLTGVFDPPPDHLAVPWPYLSAVAGAGIAAMITAALVALRAAKRPPLTVLRDL